MLLLIGVYHYDSITIVFIIIFIIVNVTTRNHVLCNNVVTTTSCDGLLLVM